MESMKYSKSWIWDCSNNYYVTLKCVGIIGNTYFTLKYVVAIVNLLFHIKLFCCNRLNLYFTSNFVDVIKVSNWVAGKFGKFELFFYINFLSLTHIYLFFFSSQYFSFTHACLPSSFFLIAISHFISPHLSSYFFLIWNLTHTHAYLSFFSFSFFHLSFPLYLTHLYLLFFFFFFFKKNLKLSLSLGHLPLFFFSS